MINPMVGSAYQPAWSADLIGINQCPPYINFRLPISPSPHLPISPNPRPLVTFTTIAEKL
ncbi:MULTISPECIES: hypothetical protein [unclassified Moorena]|uniref:hypothetical protein n=1 Tax=unclassified Moorena TaxID=2683338 RepID=UPI0013B5D944|nr:MULTISPECIES: hypothetical protein [unclassified Moorena]NEP34272.1 hypothetical protein [Moorena sp. SIO3B2]NEQ09533.1 hypothetical protein [Moorena sp. SIO4E2]